MASTEKVEQFISGLSEADKYVAYELLWPDKRLSRTQDSLQFRLPEQQAPTGTFDLLQGHGEGLGSVYTKRAIRIEKDDLNPEKLRVEIRIKGPMISGRTQDKRYSFGITPTDQIWDYKAEQEITSDERTYRNHAQQIPVPPLDEVLGHIHEAIRIEPTLKTKAS